jgi:hypothetical protein
VTEADVQLGFALTGHTVSDEGTSEVADLKTSSLGMCLQQPFIENDAKGQ